jgi:probable HAF family extracellular repeat protein
MKPKPLIRLVALFLIFSATTSLRAQLSYHVIDLGTLGGANSTANSINPSGEVCGIAQTGDGAGHAFFYTNATMYDLGTLGGAGSAAISSSPEGAAGAADTTGATSYHAFRYGEKGMADLGTLGGAQSGALGSNASGQIVGFSTVADGCDARISFQRWADD